MIADTITNLDAVNLLLDYKKNKAFSLKIWTGAQHWKAAKMINTYHNLTLKWGQLVIALINKIKVISTLVYKWIYNKLIQFLTNC